MPLRITGLIQFSETVHQELEALAIGDSDFSSSDDRLAALRQRIIDSSAKVDAICQKHHANPADMSNPSYQAYLWLKFLENKKWLLMHLFALKDFHHLGQTALNKKAIGIRIPKLKVRIRHFNYLFRVKQNKNEVLLELNEGFISAPQEIKLALVGCAFDRRTRARLKITKDFTQAEAYRRINLALKDNGEQNRQTYKGKVYDLEKLFDAINQTYFKGQLKRTRLTWSARASHRRLGYYNPDSGAITISKSLDDPSVPPLLVNYILYHEMLHHALGIRESNGRRYAHTAKFKKAEQQYEGYEEALRLMRLFSRKSL